MKLGRHQKGGIMLELTIMVVGLSALFLGTSDLFFTHLTKIEMQRIRGQVQLGQFDAAIELRQDPAFPNQVFFPLQGVRLGLFLRNVLVHAAKFVDSREYGLIVQLYYININPQTGQATGVSPITALPAVSTIMPTWCSQHRVIIQNGLNQYAVSHLNSVVSYSSGGSGVPIGQELLDVSVGTQTFKQYLPYIPVVVMGICRAPRPPMLTRAITYYFHMAAPRSIS